MLLLLSQILAFRTVVIESSGLKKYLNKEGVLSTKKDKDIEDFKFKYNVFVQEKSGSYFTLTKNGSDELLLSEKGISFVSKNSGSKFIFIPKFNGNGIISLFNKSTCMDYENDTIKAKDCKLLDNGDFGSAKEFTLLVSHDTDTVQMAKKIVEHEKNVENHTDPDKNKEDRGPVGTIKPSKGSDIPSSKDDESETEETKYKPREDKKHAKESPTSKEIIDEMQRKIDRISEELEKKKEPKGDPTPLKSEEERPKIVKEPTIQEPERPKIVEETTNDEHKEQERNILQDIKRIEDELTTQKDKSGSKSSDPETEMNKINKNINSLREELKRLTKEKGQSNTPIINAPAG